MNDCYRPSPAARQVVYSGAGTDPKQPFATRTVSCFYAADLAMTRLRFTLVLAFLTVLALVSTLTHGEPDRGIWPPGSDRLVEDWKTRRDDLEELRDIVAAGKFAAVVTLGDFLDVRASDYSQVAIENIADAELMTRLLKASNINGIAHVGGIFTFVVQPRESAGNLSEYVNYVYMHPIDAKQCKEEFRDIPCGICDVPLNEDWSIRYTWSSGRFEEEYLEGFARVYQNKDPSLSIEDVNAKREESRNVCMQSGLEEMGYDDPESLLSTGR